MASSLPKLVVKLMEVAQDPKPAIKDAATLALKTCCSVITNPDVTPLIDGVIAANMDPEVRAPTEEQAEWQRPRGPTS